MGVAEGQKEILVEDEAPKERCPASTHTHTQTSGNHLKLLNILRYIYVLYKYMACMWAEH